MEAKDFDEAISNQQEEWERKQEYSESTEAEVGVNVEAKDTVMGRDSFKGYTFGDRVWEMVKKFLEPQAEITWDIAFKAGEQIGIAKGVILKTQDLTLLNEKEIAELNAQAEDFYNKAKQVGIREVVEPSDELLEIGRKAIEDVLVEWRDNRLSEFTRGNGLVIREKDGRDSDIIRFGSKMALKIGLKAMGQAKLKEWGIDDGN